MSHLAPNNIKSFGKKISLKNNFFDQKSSKNLYFLAIFEQKFDKSVSLERSIGAEKCAIAQNDRNTILMKWVKKSKTFVQKNQKRSFFGQKVAKSGPKIQKIFEKEIFYRNRFRMAQNVF